MACSFTSGYTRNQLCNTKERSVVFNYAEPETKKITNCINCGSNDINNYKCAHCGTKYNQYAK